MRDVVEIDVPPGDVLDWLSHFQENYMAWHPDHVECRYVKGSSLFEPGSVVYIEEYLHGKLHKMRCRSTSVVPESRVDYRVAPGMGGAFIVEPREGKALFIAEISAGTRLPIIGPVLDWLVRTLLSDRMEVLRQHMAEEGKNLKRILEEPAD